MELPELPPMPGPAYGWFEDYYDGWSYIENPTERWQDIHLFTEDQMRAYALEAVRAERERIIAMLREFPFEITEPEHVEAMVAAIRAQGSKT